MFMGTRSSIEMLNGYMDGETLGTPDLENVDAPYRHICTIYRHTIRPVVAGPSRFRGLCPGQSTKMSRLGIQSARIVPHSGVAKLSAARSRPIKCHPFRTLKLLTIIEM